jgi:hypothetical protein
MLRLPPKLKSRKLIQRLRLLLQRSLRRFPPQNNDYSSNINK